MPDVDNVHIYPLVLKLLGIQANGDIDGDLAVLSSVSQGRCRRGLLIQQKAHRQIQRFDTFEVVATGNVVDAGAGNVSDAVLCDTAGGFYDFAPMMVTAVWVSAIEKLSINAISAPAV